VHAICSIQQGKNGPCVDQVLSGHSFLAKRSRTISRTVFDRRELPLAIDPINFAEASCRRRFSRASFLSAPFSLRQFAAGQIEGFGERYSSPARFSLQVGY
jgi:hypothetical protein